MGAVDPNMSHLEPVFQITIEKSISAEDSETFKSKVILNQDPYFYWTNFEGSDASFIDEITVLVWLVSIGLLVASIVISKGFGIFISNEEHELVKEDTSEDNST